MNETVKAEERVLSPNAEALLLDEIADLAPEERSELVAYLCKLGYIADGP